MVDKAFAQCPITPSVSHPDPETLDPETLDPETLDPETLKP